MSTFNYFSGLFGNDTTNSDTGIWNIYRSLGDYNTIKSGSYRKLLNAYYREEDVEGNRTQSLSDSNKTNTAAKKEFTQIKQTTDELQSSASVLLKKGEGAVYDKNDRTELISSVKSFVNDYNNVIKKAGDSSDERVLAKTLSMVNNTKAYSNSLEQIGITVKEDNTLALNSEKLEKASIETVQNLLQSTSSYVGQTVQKAAQIGAAAQSASAGTSMYGNDGSYTYQNFSSYYDTYL